MQGIRKSFPGVVALDGVSFDVRAGEVHVLLGENGAGKSTLMKILSGALAKDAGEILLGGEPVHISGPRDAHQRGIRIIYQELNLVPHLSVAENIALGREPGRFGLVDRRAGSPPREASGGAESAPSARARPSASPAHPPSPRRSRAWPRAGRRAGR